MLPPLQLACAGHIVTATAGAGHVPEVRSPTLWCDDQRCWHRPTGRRVETWQERTQRQIDEALAERAEAAR